MIGVAGTNMVQASIRLSDFALEYKENDAFLKVIVEHDHIPGDCYTNQFDYLLEDMYMLAVEEIKTFMLMNCQKIFMEKNLESPEIYNEFNTTYYEINYRI